MATSDIPLDDTPDPTPFSPLGEGDRKPDLPVAQHDNGSATHMGPTERDGPVSHDLGSNNEGVNSSAPATNDRQSSHESPSDLMHEIRALQSKLLLLEGKVVDGSGVAHNDSGRSDGKRLSHIADERQLRKQIRRAQSARKWVEEAESLANETRDERATYGVNHYMHKISPSGKETFNSGTEGIGQGGTNFQSEREYDLWIDAPLQPRRGIRPLTSLRPHYSRKLGPPNEWDISDSEEWSSDGSIQTRDFEYFRARLRGDFEWELDRLSAQKSRFEKYKKKKRINAEREEQADRKHDMAEAKVEGEEKREESIGRLAIVVNINPLEWREFRASRKTLAGSSSLIDILVGEPQVLDQFFNHYRTKEKATSHRSKAVEAHQTQKGESLAHTLASDGQAPLPERIRIHSKELIKTLRIIHGSDISSGDIPTGSLVMLRPYRMLTYYESEIRQWHSRLEKKFRKSKSLTVEDAATDKSMAVVGEEAAGKLKSSFDFLFLS